jgi:ectoine hydroxylase-related dioxygenase (phytanoyl-CoA dioxygenase family)
MNTLIRDGYLLIPQLIDVEMFDVLETEATKLVREIDLNERQLVKSLGSVGKVETNRKLLQFATSKIFIKKLESILECELRFHVGVIFSKPPFSPPTFWHQDFIGWSDSIAYSTPHSHLQVLIYLTDTNQHNGALRVIPKSHIKKHQIHDKWNAFVASCSGNVKSATSALRDYRDECAWAYDSCRDQSVLSVQKGDVIVIDTRLLHSAFGNQSPAERMLITLGYFSKFGSYSQNFRAGISKEILNQMENSFKDVWISAIERVAYDSRAECSDVIYRNQMPFF